MAAVAAATIALCGSLSPAQAVAAVPAPAHSAGPRQGAQQDQYYPDVDWIVCEINKERTRRDLRPLRISDTASQVAMGHARDMARTGRLTSTGSDGRDLRERLGDAGLFSSYISEYMLRGYHHDGHFADMANDPDPDNGLYKALMAPEVVAIGMGYANRYWDVNLLGKHRHLVTRPPSCL
ncbi:CAP domain-containing protein [Streptomyces sp. NPDC041068]|uniref:CAP domain-containing protein n=1 Tax=Streptomyces sp. NPDC041068 TaxID=3155130 RepID=UPI0033D703CF